MDDIKHGRQEVGRLNLQTLINTYPDSEYLAKAKLAIADSYYKESGTSNLALAVSGYKDFIVFFPFLPEATYAQMQVAMVHYKQMDKPDRDRTHALAAEEEFQVFLQKYPSDPLAPEATQHLREVQEVLAEGEYRILVNSDAETELTVRRGSAAHARFFNPTLGILEDAATGTAAGPLACQLVRHGILPDSEPILIEQDYSMRRPSLIRVDVKGEAVRISGRCVVSGEGKLRIHGEPSQP